MNTIKKITILLMVILFHTSCEDKLDLAPISSISSDVFFEDAKSVEAGVIAIYDGLRPIPMFEYALTEMRSDNTTANKGEGVWGDFVHMNVQSTNAVVAAYWSNNYNVIFRANLVLGNLELVTDATKKSIYEGEAKFIRAWAYFNLVRAFGGVPLADKVLSPTEAISLARSTETEIMDFIISDLVLAKDKLPNRAATAEGRATTGAAQALLAKVYLTRKDYASAKTILDVLVTSTEYSLMTNYRDVFYVERNKEIVFGVQYIGDNALYSQSFSREMTGAGTNRGLNYITADFLSVLDPADVKRKAVLVSPANPNEVGKFISNSSNATQSGNDWIVLRWADVLLMHAEAILGTTPATSNIDAIGAYNKVRVRAGMSTLPTDGSGSLNKEMLLHERRIELAFENHRLYDLIRFDVATTVMAAFGETPEGDFTFTTTDLLLPVPNAEISTTFGAIKQNPGYN